MTPSREHILRQIRRCAGENNGVPLGIERFERETGIRVADWSGKYWARWGDAVLEAGFEPNTLQGRKLDDDGLLRCLADLTAQLGRFPTTPEMRMRRQADPTFPSDRVFSQRLGNRARQIALVEAYAAQHQELTNVRDICIRALEDSESPLPGSVSKRGETDDGYVYLLRAGRAYKIGRSNFFDRRERELAVQLPERAERVHVIRTDDPVGIERYWHHRFASLRKNGEWFNLSADDVRAFRRRKFM